MIPCQRCTGHSDGILGAINDLHRNVFVTWELAKLSRPEIMRAKGMFYAAVEVRSEKRILN
ncbi:MAG: hypothetical protein CBE00_03775 [Planctomycetaceae bacterium TMED240]|nr:hypothetical protein [Rhodopirellula sp.]OUX07778.1 MAG: hypothetical protein CBE00_03775 [Planctomycetaceae bacterium TMED240]